jgi:hypothetical protein
MESMPARKPTAIVQLKVRLRENLRRRLELAAERREDSINNEIVRRLEGSFKRDADQGLASEVRALRRENEKFSTMILDLLKRNSRESRIRGFEQRMAALPKNDSDREWYAKAIAEEEMEIAEIDERLDEAFGIAEPEKTK